MPHAGKKTELPITAMLIAVALGGAALGSMATSAHNWADYGFAAVDALLTVGLIRSIASHIKPRLAPPEANAGTSPANPLGSDAQ